MTFPLVAFGSQPLQVEFQKEPIFEGTLKDVASPYLGVAALASLGVGAVSLSINEWRKSSQKQATAQAAVSQLQQELKQKETQLEELQLSDTLLKANGYYGFLEPEFSPASVVVEETAPAPEVRLVPPNLPGEAVSASRPVAKPSMPAMSPISEAVPVRAPQAKPVMPQMQPSSAAPVPPAQVPVRSINPPAPSVPVHAVEAIAQPVIHALVTPVSRPHAQPDRPVRQTPVDAPLSISTSAQFVDAAPEAETLTDSAAATSNLSTVAVLAQVNALQNQLRQMTSHVATLQSSLLTTVEPDPSATADSSTLVIEHLHRRLQRLESDWTRTRAVS